MGKYFLYVNGEYRYPLLANSNREAGQEAKWQVGTTTAHIQVCYWVGDKFYCDSVY